MMVSAESLPRLWPLIFLGSIVLLMISIVTGLMFGAVPISLEQIVSWLTFTDVDNGDFSHVILEQLRLPRTLLAVVVGAVLASSGAVTQGLFRNPLADPSLIGVSAGASAGASIAIVLLQPSGASLMGLSIVSVAAFAGSCIVVVLVYRLATNTQGTSVATMLLAGIALTFLAGSLTSLLEFLADNTMLRRISLWRMGGLDAANGSRLLLVTVIGFISIAVFYRYRYALNALLLGESEARHLGINVDRVKFHIILCVAAAVGVSVAVAGTIAFIGLVVPHVIRIIVGPNHRYLIPLSATLGAALLVNADTLSRLVLAPTELPVGLVTAAIGAPMFISLLRRRSAYGS
ncbi:FecCD family ABC transporter permease [Teredinibacter waterburyi]|uniref:FecCD family ABC transporter permease n=1 Tax=Teredinibacter waterburyi TaxID=1500538 RepID=UPI00165F5178|nr:iron ABC transporter permease [Teredinibacter waterburyi]